MNSTLLVQQSRDYASAQLLHQLPDHLFFHNYEHTESVAAAAIEIGTAVGLSDDDMETVLIAAWFHDLGYLKGSKGHEARSAEIAATQLIGWKASLKKIDDVQRTILATTMPQHPLDLMGQVICDSDLHHLATDHVIVSSINLRKEFAIEKELCFTSDRDWYLFNVKFMQAHRYFTDYGKQVLQARKEENIKLLMKKIYIMS
jgi:predicted metal-dependent HD superfamily phosphohydrolase